MGYEGFEREIGRIKINAESSRRSEFVFEGKRSTNVTYNNNKIKYDREFAENVDEQ